MVFKAKSPKINIEEVRALSKLEGAALARKNQRDQELEAIIRGEDQRILLVIGPCSSDNEEAVLEYAKRLSALQEEVKDRIFMVMRVYTAKPRTNGDGYKGLIHQPNATEAPSLINGIKAVRQLHYRVITETGMTTADEMLYPENLPLVDDLISYMAVGARSVEDQQHRFVASGADFSTGFKNPTSGNLNVMFNGIYAAQNKQSFNLMDTIDQYEKMGLENPFIIIDTNHDNSGKQYMDQIRIVRQTLINRDWNEKIKKYVRGFMIESYLEDGRQNEPEVFGKSITDPCLGWDNTEALVREIYQTLGE